ncbi:polynucleotide 3'-phosphatase ZDP-like [Euphorbia lathyris]|uniref:polynucleotide 3'-phosphatase ZDP-like n=1 Tax=Euphorbia lathyris TaxID=212925 RepID=UPI0033144466
MPPSEDVKILAEYAKSKMSSCKKCSQFIQAKTLRLGLVSRDPRGFDMAKWHHLDCFSEKVESTDEILGFAALKENDQEALKKLILGVKDEGNPNAASKSANENEDEFELEEETSKRKKTSKKKKGTYEIGEELETAMPPSKEVQIMAEYAKSKRSSCKKCSQFIQAKTLRVGLVSRDPRGFDMAKWHHLDCFSEKVESTEEIIGFASLKENDQEALKKLIAGVKDVVEGSPNSASKSTNENVDKFELEEETSKKKKKTYEIGEELENPAMPPSVQIMAEYAKSKRSSCKKCSQFIQAKTLRLGLVSKDPRGFDMAKWHHLDCFSEKVESTEEIIGFASLKENDQEALKKLISGVKDMVEGSPNSASKRTDESGEELELKGKKAKKRKKTV